MPVFTGDLVEDTAAAAPPPAKRVFAGDLVEPAKSKGGDFKLPGQDEFFSYLAAPAGKSAQRGTTEFGPKATAADLPEGGRAKEIRGDTTVPEDIDAGDIHDRIEKRALELKAKHIDPRTDKEYRDLVRQQGIAWRENNRQAVQYLAGAGGAAENTMRSGIGGALKETVKSGGGLSRKVGKILGADKDPEATFRAENLSAKFGPELVPPSSWMKESPKIQLMVESFDRRFRTQDVLKQNANRYYDTEAGKLLDNLGVATDKREPPTKATQPVSVEKAGSAIIEKYRAETSVAEAKLDAAMAEQKAARLAQVTGTPGELGRQRQGRVAELTKAAQDMRDSAQKLVDAKFDEIKGIMGDLKRRAGIGENPGDYMRMVSGKIRWLNKAVKDQAAKIYKAADEAAGNARPNVEGLADSAQEFLLKVPEDFERTYPYLVKAIGELQNGQVTFGQLHNLRSILRSDINHADLTASIKQGSLKVFEDKIDEVLHDAHADPRLKDAAKLLDQGDAYYRKNIPRFRDDTIQGIVDATMKANLPPDPAGLAGALFPGTTEKVNTEVIRAVKKIVGPQAWSAVLSADLKRMFDASKTLVDGQVNGSDFAKEVLTRIQSGVFEAGYDRELTAKLREQAQRVAAIEGKLPISELPGDTVASFLQRAEDYAAEAKKIAKEKPLDTLKKDLDKIDKDAKAQRTVLKDQQANDPLHFLNDANVGAIAAADHILGNPDLFMQAALRFDEDSPEFKALRQVAAQRLFQRETIAGFAKQMHKDISPEVQRLIFPGVTLEDAKTLALDIVFLTKRPSGGLAGGFAATSKVEHPKAALVGEGLGKVLPPWLGFPGLDFALRAALTKYYAAITWGATHPQFIHWVSEGLRGTPIEREVVRTEVQKLMDRMAEKAKRVRGPLRQAGIAEMNQQNRSQAQK